MKIKQAIDELTHLLQEHGDVDLYMSIDVKPFIQHIENGHTAPVSGAEFIVYEPEDGTGVEASVVIRDWPY
ncbi:hypothetical protein [Atlantibacter hermannii]|uniref:hypothetical protein n=1 Tax=Atlantibacter hermannii TaxID=565 RepID=UPI0028AE0542|nr:hypothetical protein [Atlantibacter hermannii]